MDFSKALPIPTPEITSTQESRRLAKLHLQETDWYIVRFIEIGEPVPAEITASRAEARATLAK